MNWTWTTIIGTLFALLIAGMLWFGHVRRSALRRVHAGERADLTATHNDRERSLEGEVQRLRIQHSERDQIERTSVSERARQDDELAKRSQELAHHKNLAVVSEAAMVAAEERARVAEAKGDDLGAQLDRLTAAQTDMGALQRGLEAERARAADAQDVAAQLRSLVVSTKADSEAAASEFKARLDEGEVVASALRAELDASNEARCALQIANREKNEALEANEVAHQTARNALEAVNGELQKVHGAYDAVAAELATERTSHTDAVGMLRAEIASVRISAAESARWQHEADLEAQGAEIETRWSVTVGLLQSAHEHALDLQQQEAELALASAWAERDDASHQRQIEAEELRAEHALIEATLAARVGLAEWEREAATGASEALTERLCALETDVERATVAAEQADRRADEADQARQRWETLHRAVTDELRQREDDVATMALEQSVVMNELGVLASSLADACDTSAEQKRMATQFNENAVRLTQELADLHDEFATSERALSKANAEVGRLDVELLALSSSKERGEAHIRGLESMLTEKDAALTDMRDSVEGMTATAEAARRDMEVRSNAFSHESAGLKASLLRTEQERTILEARCQVAVRDRDELKAQVATLTGELARVREELDTNDDARRALAERARTSAQELSASNHARARLEHDAASLADQCLEFNLALEELRTERDSREQALGDEQKRCESLEEAVAVLQGQNAKSQRDIAALHVEGAAAALALKGANFAKQSGFECDDLTVIDGIGPRVRRALVAVGITTWHQLGETDEAHVRESLRRSGVATSMNVATWTSQARALAGFDVEGFRAYASDDVGRARSAAAETGDDLLAIEGLDERCREALGAVGVTSFARLAESSEGALQAILVAANLTLPENYRTWADQAKSLDGHRLAATVGPV